MGLRSILLCSSAFVTYVQIQFRDVLRLEDETWAHIQEFHPEFTQIKLIESMLLDPDIIVRSNWDIQSILYYKQIGLRRFRVVVVQTVESRIKTTLTTDKIKRGEVLWAKEKPTD